MKPGELSTPHAQILASTLTSQRCASCHPEAATSTAEWFSKDTAGHQNVTQSDRCLDCHHTTIQRSTATLAHNLPKRMRARLRPVSITEETQTWQDLLPGPAIDQENIQCSACHREHRGADGNLLDISDSQCQTCHSDRFGSFATSHVDWDDWPYGRGRSIAFNHFTHATKHFPATARGTSVAQFQCTDCHPRSASGELERSANYERSCAQCHDEALRIEAAEGFELLALPTLPEESAERVHPWPESATGFFDGVLSPLADLMIRADANTDAAIRQLPQRDFGRIDPHNRDSVAACETIARAYRQLLLEFGSDGQRVFVERMNAIGISSDTLKPLLRSLSPQLVRETHSRWFTAEIGRGVRQIQFQDSSAPPASLLIDERELDFADSLIPADGIAESDLLALPDADSHTGDPLAEDLPNPKSREAAATFDAERMVPLGGWFRDDSRMAIRYRGGGHDDPVLKSAIDLINQLPIGDPARASMLSNRAIAACIACHPGALRRGIPQWRSEALIGRKHDFTKFSHAPHLNIATLADCRHCHRIGGPPSGTTALVGARTEIREFAPLSRQSCAACHTPQAAGDACVKCHRYHIDLR